jgi:HD-GYP domain-containing protein (c-di-GMP phosphodiesterase class II)
MEYINPVVEELTGYSPHAFYCDPDLIQRIVHPDDRCLHDIPPQTGNRPVILRWVDRQGQAFWVEEERVPIRNHAGKITIWEGMARPITPTAAEGQIAEQLADQRKRLMDASGTVAAGASMESTVQGLLESLQSMLDFDSCTLFLNGNPAGRLKPVQVFPNGFKSQTSPIQPSIIRSVYQTGKAEMADENSAEPSIPWLAVPLPSRDHPLGVLTLTRPQGSPFCEQDLGLVKGIASYTALAVQNAQLIREKKTRVQLERRLAAFNRLSGSSTDPQDIYANICESARGISAARGVALYHFDAQDQQVRHWSEGVSNSLTRQVAQTLTPMFQSPLKRVPVLRLIPDLDELPEADFWHSLGQREGIRAVLLCPLTYENQLLARVDCYYPQPHDGSDAENSAMLLFARQAVIAMQNRRLYMDLEDAYLQTMLTLARVIDARDSYTARHSQKLAGWAETTATMLSCTPEEIRNIRWAAQLHDIGKIAIPDSILRKAGPLTEDEWVVMRRHPVIGAEIVSPLKRLEPVTPLIRAHQEKMDGTGYPDGLCGDQIPLGARILTVVDSFGAMTDDRVYRPALSPREAASELKRCAGRHFDPQVVSVFSRIIEN